jgi:2-polyprenyl-3-methyl-5-hydroxy-6-metoxy-1,4-benzoquinol methylase
MDGNMSIEWIHVDCCPVCGGMGYPSISNYDQEINDTIHVYFCPSCRSAYHNPHMSQNSMTEYYSSGAYRTHPTRQYIPQLAAHKKRAAEMKVLMLEAFRTDMKVEIKRSLDFGCGLGHMVNAMKDRYNCEAIGFDIYTDPHALVSVVNDKDKLTGKFDVITCVHVLEHFPNPMEELDWMVSMLTENGLLFIEIPFTKLVFPPHPILFSRESVGVLMKRIKARYMYYDMAYLTDNGLIFCQPNHPTYVADLHPSKIEYFRENDDED